MHCALWCLVDLPVGPDSTVPGQGLTRFLQCQGVGIPSCLRNSTAHRKVQVELAGDTGPQHSLILSEFHECHFTSVISPLRVGCGHVRALESAASECAHIWPCREPGHYHEGDLSLWVCQPAPLPCLPSAGHARFPSLRHMGHMPFPIVTA